ncbi:menaquinol-cytochrome c reductase cytochrome c1 subunit precursor [Georgenia soli]|uniref:Cytochrome bc1 complex cytochrome c subunit n=1 Tax=Georgenia soli TaxID=638953 RepID=A0A2A9EG21_9MICO|nr:c-type cytochrome [Georgenia soli]PFG37868.1 menaquinol-cytochrome c reductase cytochrome c1 subunit precursor [Georgenia soli]
MKALANSRRNRYAPAVLLLLALILTGALYAVLAPKPATATTGGNAQDVEAGKALFEANCSTCHGLDGEGTDVAPSLIGVGAASVDFQMATGRMPMANNSPQAEAKPAQFDAEQISQVAAYVASLGPGPAIPSAEQVDPAGGDPANGLALFRTNCAMCHNAVGAGGALSEGKYAPALYDSTPTEIYEAMLTGPQSMPVFNEANIDPQGKQDIIAYLMEQREPSVGGISLGSLGPVAEGLWVWIIGIGGLIAAAVWVGAKSS